MQNSARREIKFVLLKILLFKYSKVKAKLRMDKYQTQIYLGVHYFKHQSTESLYKSHETWTLIMNFIRIRL